ncbi:hypothetical protein [Ureibacillus sp. GCM10028918]|uniref:hypothetical protein n=1 Tax=Ureibacillus sp. GCM10028918 TaxID=3273429 RepID=UPI0036175085
MRFFLRKVENALSAPTTTGGAGKRTLFVLEDSTEVVEELAFATRQKEKWNGLVQFRQQLEELAARTLFVLEDSTEVVEELAFANSEVLFSIHAVV